jgi:hypothetical protein
MGIKTLRNSLMIVPGLMGVIGISSAVAQGAPPTNPKIPQAERSLSAMDSYAAIESSPNPDSFDQVTSVSQLSDVKPTDWAFQALQSLVERYGCIVGYPDRTYRGNRALSRYEFAAGLNACLNRMNELIATSVADFVRREDLVQIQKLQEEFASELAVLRGRIDSLEVRTATLEKQQFSTTTKLVGEAIFNLSDEFNQPFKNNTVFQDRVRIGLLTSFTGKDLLTTRLTAGNVQTFTVPPNAFSGVIGKGTAEGLSAIRYGSTGDNSVAIDRLDYTFPLGERLRIFVAAAGGRSGYYVYNTLNPYFEDFDGGNGAITTFGQESPIYRIGGGSGAALNFAFDANKVFVVSLGYLATNASNPATKNGLFNGDYSAFGQLTLTPTDWFQIGFTYVNAYHTPGNSIFNAGTGNNVFYTGTVAANALHTGISDIGALAAPIIPGRRFPAVTNSYGIEGSIRITPGIVLNAFGGFTALRVINSGDGQIWYYGAGLAFPDLFKRGNVGGIIVGREPYLGSIDLRGAIPATLGLPGTARLADLNLGRSASLHLEAFYKFQVTPNISVTPGIVWITNPDQDRLNQDLVVGTIRTTFSF